MRYLLTAKLSLFYTLLILCGLSACARAAPEPGDATKAKADKKTTTTMTDTSAYDRVEQAQAKEKITPREAVLLKAKLLFKPDLIDKKSPFRPKPGEAATREDCGTGFYLEIHQNYEVLSREDRELLKSLSPDLRVIIDNKEKKNGKSGESTPTLKQSIDEKETSK